VPYEPVPGGGLHTSVFADLFVALGFAGLARHRPDDGWAERSLDILLRSAAAIAAGDFRSEPYPVAHGHLSFGLPMILVGVGEQVFRATGSGEAATVVRQAAGQIEERFRTGDDVAEMPRTDGTDDGSLLARHRTPGHVLECLWFLHHARDLLVGGPLSTPDVLVPLAEHALRLGWDEQHGGLFRYTDVDGGEPTGTRSDDPYEELVVSTWDTKLWWPHAEALYATALLARVTGDPGMREWHDRVRRYTLGTFPEGPGREWTQIRDRTGAPMDRTVALPVKDPFHVARALLLLAELNLTPELVEERP
jgi:N-acylglucosamine 2-epimerase